MNAYEARGKVLGMRDAVLGRLQRRLGVDSPAVREAVEALENPAQLDQALDLACSVSEEAAFLRGVRALRNGPDNR